MGNGVKGFFLYFDQCGPLEELTDEQCGQLLRACVARFQGEDFDITDPMVRLVFRFFEADYKRDVEKYESKCAQMRANAKSKKQTGATSNEKAEASNCEQMQADASKSKQMLADATNCNQTQAEASRSTQQPEPEPEEYKNKNKTNTPLTPLLGGACEGEVIDDPNIPPSQKAKGKHPTVAEVAAYCNARGNTIDPQTFVDYFTAQGWKLSNGRPLKDWQAAVRTWEQRRKQDSRNNSRVQFHPSSANAVSQHNMAVMNRVLAEMGDM